MYNLERKWKKLSDIFEIIVLGNCLCMKRNNLRKVRMADGLQAFYAFCPTNKELCEQKTLLTVEAANEIIITMITNNLLLLRWTRLSSYNVLYDFRLFYAS